MGGSSSIGRSRFRYTMGWSSPVTFVGCVMGAFLVVHGMPDGMQQVLNEHNIYRCMHGVQTLTWDETVASSAQNWADTGTCGKCQHDPDNKYGENIECWSPPGVPSSQLYEGVDDWYSEIKDTDNGRIDHFTMETGHYTQVVWKNTASLGCGYCGGSMVCRYDPPGNYAGQFTANVNSPVKTKEECTRASITVVPQVS